MTGSRTRRILLGAAALAVAASRRFYHLGALLLTGSNPFDAFGA